MSGDAFVGGTFAGLLLGRCRDNYGSCGCLESGTDSIFPWCIFESPSLVLIINDT